MIRIVINSPDYIEPITALVTILVEELYCFSIEQYDTYSAEIEIITWDLYEDKLDDLENIYIKTKKIYDEYSSEIPNLFISATLEDEDEDTEEED